MLNCSRTLGFEWNHSHNGPRRTLRRQKRFDLAVICEKLLILHGKASGQITQHACPFVKRTFTPVRQ